MQIWRVTRAVLASAFVLTVAAPAAAQQSSPAPGASGGAPLGEVGLTYSILRSDEETSPVGFGLSVSRRVARSSNAVDVQVAGEVGANHFAATTDFDASTQTSFMAGVRFVGRGNASAAPFAQVCNSRIIRSRWMSSLIRYWTWRPHRRPSKASWWSRCWIFAPTS